MLLACRYCMPLHACMLLAANTLHCTAMHSLLHLLEQQRQEQVDWPRPEPPPHPAAGQTAAAVCQRVEGRDWVRPRGQRRSQRGWPSCRHASRQGLPGARGLDPHRQRPQCVC